MQWELAHHRPLLFTILALNTTKAGVASTIFRDNRSRPQRLKRRYDGQELTWKKTVAEELKTLQLQTAGGTVARNLKVAMDSKQFRPATRGGREDLFLGQCRVRRGQLATSHRRV